VNRQLPRSGSVPVPATQFAVRHLTPSNHMSAQPAAPDFRPAGNAPSRDAHQELPRHFLIALARAQLARPKSPDALSVGFEQCLRAALTILQQAVPWSDANPAQRQAWAEQPDEFSEQDLIQWLLQTGVAGIALGQTPPALTIYHWLCSALPDPSDLRLIWAVALLRAQRWHEAQACLAQLDHNDELVRALSALTCAHATPQEAIQHLQQIQRNAQQQSARELARELLLALALSEESAAEAESDFLDLAN